MECPIYEIISTTKEWGDVEKRVSWRSPSSVNSVLLQSGGSKDDQEQYYNSSGKLYREACGEERG
jgi:hypothetical protein